MTPFFSSTFWALTVCDIHFCVWKLPKFIFMGSSFRPIWHGKYLNFAGVGCEIRILFSFDSANILIKESKKPGFTFSLELRTIFVWTHFYFCFLQNATFHRVEAKVLKFYAHFSQNAVFIDYNIFSLLLVICLSWNLHPKLSHVFLTFI